MNPSYHSIDIFEYLLSHKTQMSHKTQNLNQISLNPSLAKEGKDFVTTISIISRLSLMSDTNHACGQVPSPVGIAEN
jgi:hypothetical protein